MLSKVVLLAALIAVACAGQSPNAKVVESFRKTSLGSKFSSDVYEDAMLDAPGLISKYGYPVEVHTVTTSDGYILEAHRIPHGRDRNNQPGQRPVVFLMHGLLSSSADYVVLGPENALAYVLAEEGFDVWIGNARGNYYSKKHTTLDPDNINFWSFSWEEIGLYDLPAFIDYILNLTGESQLHYVGHSQGGTVFFVLNSLLPEYNAKFKSFQGLAPASYFEYNDHALINNLAQYEVLLETAGTLLGIGEILNNEQAQSLVSSHVCDGEPIFNPLCVEALMNNSVAMSTLDSKLIPLFLAHAPAGSSLRQVAHFGQVIRRNVFARYNYNIITNLRLYGSVTPPEFQVSRITVPSFIYYGQSDLEVNYRDILTLAARLGNTVEVIRTSRDDFHHYDFIWATDAKQLLYSTVLANIRKFE